LIREFFECRASDGFRLLGVLSKPTNEPLCLLVHVHGYGGDFYSNAFLRVFHERLPAHSIAFLSFNLRTSGYLTEAYTEDHVEYVGSAVVDHDAALADVEGVVRSLSTPMTRIVLQGHSFGTNIVKRYAALHPEVERLVFLSPSDSRGLFTQWSEAQGMAGRSGEGDDIGIRWDLFGMSTTGGTYPLPISQRALDCLLGGSVFEAWSRDAESLGQAALVLQGQCDPISNFGSTGAEGALTALLPNATVRQIPAVGHLFAGAELEACDAVAAWLTTTAPPVS
jgi:pimeloyl-ACP methyl ester carboxylesterase